MFGMFLEPAGIVVTVISIIVMIISIRQTNIIPHTPQIRNFFLHIRHLLLCFSVKMWYNTLKNSYCLWRISQTEHQKKAATKQEG